MLCCQHDTLDATVPFVRNARRWDVAVQEDAAPVCRIVHMIRYPQYPFQAGFRRVRRGGAVG